MNHKRKEGPVLVVAQQRYTYTRAVPRGPCAAPCRITRINHRDKALMVPIVRAHDSMREALGEDIEPRLRELLDGHQNDDAASRSK